MSNAATIRALQASLSCATELALRERLERVIKVLRIEHSRAERHSPSVWIPAHNAQAAREVHLAADCGRLLYAASSVGGVFDLSERILVFTGPQFTHLKFWSAKSLRVGCGSISACIISL